MASSLWGSQDGAKSKRVDNWMNGFISAVNLLETDLSVLYLGIKTADDAPLIAKDEFKSTDTSMQEMAEKFVSHCDQLIEILSESTHGKVLVPEERLWRVVRRCLTVTMNDVYSVPSMAELLKVLPTVHKSMFNVITQCVLSCKSRVKSQNLFLIDFCVKALQSTTGMKQTERSEYRSNIYRILCLLVETFCWNFCLTSQLKVLSPVLISDIKLQKETKQALNSSTDKQKVEGRKKKRGKKRNNKAESYSELTVTFEDLQDETEDSITSSTSNTLVALQLSRLALVNTEFIFVENLMRCILDTTKTLQADGLISPYTGQECRKELYEAVFDCFLVSLGHSCSSKMVNTYRHLSSTALSLLNSASSKDCSIEIIKTCEHALKVRWLLSNKNVPMTRRFLPEESTEKEDILEIDRERQRLSEENEQLRQKLVDMEIENQQQAYLVSELQLELKELKKQNSLQLDKVEVSQQKVDETVMDDMEEEQSEDVTVTSPVDSLASDKSWRMHRTKNLQDQIKEPTTTQETHAESNQQTGLKRKHTPGTPRSQLREAGTKKSKTEIRTPEQDHSKCLQAMISDFVDAEPDVL